MGTMQLRRERNEKGETSLTMLIDGVKSPLDSFSKYSLYLTGAQCVGAGIFTRNSKTEQFHFGRYSHHFQFPSTLDVDFEKSTLQEVTDAITERVVTVREWVQSCKSNATIEITTIPLENIAE